VREEGRARGGGGGGVATNEKETKYLKFMNSLISGFRREANENCVLLGYYAASSYNSLPTFRDNLSAISFQGQESKVGMEFPLLAAFTSLLLYSPYRVPSIHIPVFYKIVFYYRLELIHQLIFSIK
jgi:hypothetical protein